MRHRRLRFGLLATALGAALVVAACGGGGSGPAVSAAPPQEKVTVTPETAANPFALQAGTYRLSWKTTGCTSVTVAFVGDTGYSREKSSNIPNFSWIMTSVTDGNYTVSQTDPSCTQWEIVVEKVG